MRKHFALLALLGGVLAQAAPVTPSQALLRVISDNAMRRVASRQSNSIQLIAELPQLYVFSSGSGFMICPADDAAPTLLGYSDSGTFDAEGNPALSYWLQTYAEQIQRATGNEQRATPPERPYRKPIEPLIQTKWDQGSPYNDFCPQLGGRPCWTGCVATAMAQVTRFYQWPDKGEGTHSYDWAGQTLSFDFGNTIFDWANMPETYGAKSTDEQKKAVATLMSACGIGANMSYSGWMSIASPMDMAPALIDHMRYGRDAYWVHRDYYSMLQWEEIIYNELATGRPILYSGSSTSGGGHQFVCDGYDTDGYFHINWGWSGISDGYFRLSALDPATLGAGGGTGGYNVGQEALLNLHPAKGDEKPVYYVGSKLGVGPVNEANCAVGKSVEFYGPFVNTSALPLPVGTKVSLRFTSTTSDAEFSIEETSTKELLPNEGWSTLGWKNFPPNYSAGEYRVRAYFTIPGCEPQEVQIPYDKPAECFMTIAADGKISFVSPAVETGKPVYTDLTYTGSKYYYNSELKMKFILTNESESADFSGHITPALLYADRDQVACTGDAIFVTLTAGESKDYSLSRTLYPEKQLLAPGTYRLTLRDASGNNLGEPVELEYAYRSSDVSASVTGFNLTSATDQAAVKFKVTAECTQGYFLGNYIIAICPSDDVNSILVKVDTPEFSIPSGSKQTQNITADLSELAPGDYQALLLDSKEKVVSGLKALSFSFEAPEEPEEPEDGLSDLSNKSDKSDSYDLQGRKVASPRRGLYIQRGKLILK